MLLKIVGLLALFAVCNAQRLRVDVYYESLCPDSARFINDQLYPAKRGPLGKYFDVNLVPFGKASWVTFGADVNFTCQHGPPECYGNKIQACALEHIQVNSYQNTHTRDSLILEYVNCLMKLGNQRDSVYPGARCASAVQLANWPIIEQCANSTDGSKYLQNQGMITQQLQPALTSVPTVVFKQQYSSELQDLAMRNFQSAVCRALPQPKPSECSQIPGSATNNVALLPAIVTFALFVLLTRLF